MCGLNVAYGRWRPQRFRPKTDILHSVMRMRDHSLSFLYTQAIRCTTETPNKKHARNKIRGLFQFPGH